MKIEILKRDRPLRVSPLIVALLLFALFSVNTWLLCRTFNDAKIPKAIQVKRIAIPRSINTGELDARFEDAKNYKRFVDSIKQK